MAEGVANNDMGRVQVAEGGLKIVRGGPPLLTGFFEVSADTGQPLHGVPAFHKQVPNYGDVPDI
jgi:hypothetical protein